MKKIEKQSQKIIDSYLKDLQNFLKENNLDKDLAKDIEERILEKLESKKDIQKSDVQNILEEIGSPEEIFAEEISEGSDSYSGKKNIFGKFVSKENEVIFLGVFKELGDKTQIPAIFYRILYLLLLFMSFLAGPTSMGGILLVGYFFGFLILRTGVFRLFFSLGFVFLFIVLLIPSIILFGAYLGDFSFGNMYPFMGISPFFPIGMVIGIFSLILLIIIFFQYAFFRKFSLKFFTTGIVMAIIAITFGGAVIFDFIGKYSMESEFTQEAEVSLEGKKQITLLSPEYNFVENGSLMVGADSLNMIAYEALFHVERINYYIPPWNFQKSPDDKIHVQYKIGLRGNNELKEKGKGYIKGIDLEIEDGIISSTIKTDTESKYPLISMNIGIESIQIPENIIFNIDSWSADSKAEVEKEDEILKKYRLSCRKLVFIKDSEVPQCIIDETNRKQYYEKAISYFLQREGLEKIIPLKFSKPHYNWDLISNGEYNPDTSIVTYRASGEYNFEDNMYKFKVSDGQATFTIEAKIIKNTEKQVFEVEEVKIIDYEGELNKEWYKNPEFLEKIQ